MYIAQTALFDPSLIKPTHSFLATSMATIKCGIYLNLQALVATKFLTGILIFNYGSATWTSQITGNESTPDISLCGSNWSVKTSWRLAKPIGNSGRLPTVIEINHYTLLDR